MSSPGYRNTAPVRLYMEFSREHLENLDSGAFAGDDPFDLQNTLVGFDYSLTESENAGSFIVTLINPSQQVEKKIFSWYCAVNPRKWAAKQEATPEEWAASATSMATVYVRWGYDNDTISKDSPVKKAYSHIHKTHLYDIDFSVSDKKERIVKLYFLNNHDIGIQRQRSGFFGGRVKTYPVKIVKDQGGMKEPSRIISEILGKVASSERGIKTFVKLSDEHKEILDDEFDKLHPGINKQWPTGDELDGSTPIDQRDPEKPTSTKITLDVVTQYFNYLDLSVSLHPPGSPNFKGPRSSTPVPAVNQTGVGAGSQDPQTFNKAEQASKVADQTTFIFESNIPDYVHNATDSPVSGLYDLQDGQEIIGVYEYRLLNKDRGSDHTLQGLQEIFDSGEVEILAFPRSKKDKFLSAYNNASNKDDYIAVNPNGGTKFSIEGFSIKDHIQTRLTAEHANRDEILENQAPSGTEQEMQADQDLFAALSGVAEEPEQNLTDESTVYASCSNTFSFVNSFISLLNRTFFNLALEYLGIQYIQTSVVPKGERQNVEAKLADLFDVTEIDWDKPETDTICLIGNLTDIEEVLRFDRDIKSFPIQVENDPDVISIATGFNKRKDNIIINLDHRVSKGSFYNTILASPAIPQKLYDVAKRFESDSYRELIYSQLQFVLRKQADVSESYYVEGNPSYNVSTEFTQLGTAAFPETLIQNAVSQVSRFVNGLDSDVVGISSESAKSKLFKSLSEDIAFIYNNEFMDVFFPEISEDKLDDIRVINYVDGDKIEDKTSFRFISNAPLSVLRKKLEDGDIAQKLAYAAKLQAMFAFKKTISDIRIRTLGVPEMDILAYEIGVRECAVWISEPRVPGTFHWLSGIYLISNVSHQLDVSNGYTSEFTLIPAASDSADEMIKYTFLKDV